MRVEVCLEKSDTVCKCGKTKKAAHRRCNSCRQKASHKSLKSVAPQGPCVIDRYARIVFEFLGREAEKREGD